MSFLNPSDLEQYNITTAAPGTTQLTPDSWTDGLPKGVLQGVVGAAAGVGQLGMDVVNSFPTTESAGQQSPRFNPFSTRTTATSFNNFKNAPPQARSELSKSIQSTLDEMRAYSRIDPRVQGGGAQLAAGLTRGLTLGVSGFALGGAPGAAALLGSTEADSAYHDAKEQGLDNTTAYELSALAGVTNAAGAFLPMAAGGAGLRGLAQSLLTGAGLNVTVGAANRFATSEILERNGYADMARQYQAADASAMAADALLGAAFGGLGHLGKVRDPAQIRDATEALKGEHIDRSGPGIPVTPEAAQAHIDELANAIHAIDRGRAVEVDSANADMLARQTAEDPAITALQRQAVEQITAEEPGAADLAKPVEVPEKPWTPPEEPPAEEAAAAKQAPVAPTVGEESGPGVNPQAMLSLDALVKSHPDLEITLDDGRMVKVGQLPEMIDQQMTEARRLSALHDVAAACFRGTE